MTTDEIGIQSAKRKDGKIMKIAVKVRATLTRTVVVLSLALA